MFTESLTTGSGIYSLLPFFFEKYFHKKFTFSTNSHHSPFWNLRSVKTPYMRNSASKYKDTFLSAAVILDTPVLKQNPFPFIPNLAQNIPLLTIPPIILTPVNDFR